MLRGFAIFFIEKYYLPKVLQAYSHPILDQIKWETTEEHKVTILNETIDYYRYYDATKQAEFLYASVEDTIKNIIPAEVNYLIKYDQFKSFLDNQFEMPDKLVNVLVRFLEQNAGKLSQRARTKELESLTDTEIEKIEAAFAEAFV